MTTVHLLQANGAEQAPYADLTLCGEPVVDETAAFWPGDHPDAKSRGGKWCRACKAREKHAIAHPVFQDGCTECLEELDTALHQEWARQHPEATDDSLGNELAASLGL